MASKPNLFHYATSELSQDAFICWLLAWADRDNAGFDVALHEAGVLVLNALLHLHGVPPITGERVVIRRQLRRADVVVEVGEAFVLLIEDKANAAEHGDQLQRYVTEITALYPDRKVLPIFLKTGDQSSYKAALNVGYRLFLRKDFLNVLRVGRRRGVSNAVFSDFLEHLEQLDQAREAYAQRPMEEWDRHGWIGFYLRLQELIPDLGWGEVANQAGGFMGAWWHFREWEGWDVYLQLEQQNLVLKLGGGQETSARARAELRDRWLARLQKASQGHHLSVQRPAWFGNGRSMTAGWIKQDGWLITGPGGKIDVEGVVGQLAEVAAILDRALQASN